MNPDIKARWIADLRSGRYVQGVGALKRFSGDMMRHCCLGVLCEQYLEVVKPPGVQWDRVPGDLEMWEIHDQHGYLPVFVAEWAGLVSPSGGFDVEVDDDIEEHSLADHNDGACGAAKLDFEGIARLIEEHF